MKDKFFIDTNILVYLFDKDKEKAGMAKNLVLTNALISTQVLAEMVNVLVKKLEFSKEEAIEAARFISNNIEVSHVNKEIVNKAFEVSLKYGYSIFDSIIIVTALKNKCSVLYSEDMQHNQKIEKKLTIVNPFI